MELSRRLRCDACKREHDVSAIDIEEDDQQWAQLMVTMAGSTSVFDLCADCAAQFFRALGVGQQPREEP